MLTIEALNAALSLSMIADKNDFVLLPMNGTPLANLYNATSRIEPDEMARMIQNGEGELDLNRIAEWTSHPLPNTDYVEHNEVMTEMTAFPVEAAQSQINFARTVVMPVIQEIVEKTKGALLNGDISEWARYKVSTYEYPSVLFRNGFLGIVDDAKGTNPNFVMENTLKFPIPEEAELLKLFETGAASIDKDISTWLAVRGAGFPAMVFRKFFSVDRTLEEANSTLNAQLGNGRDMGGYTTFDLAVGVLLIARSLAANPIANSGLGLADYQSFLKGYQEVAANVLVNAVAEIEQQLKSGLIIRNKREYEVVVNDHVYLEWLKDEANCPEIILGTLLENGTTLFVDYLNANRGRLLDKWDNHLRLLKAAEQAELHTQIKRLLRNYFNEHFMSQRAEHPEHEGAILLAVKNFERELNNFTADELRGIWLPCTKAVCRAAYPASQAEEILIGMEEASKVNPDSDPRELATFVLLGMVSRFVAQQIVVSGKGSAV